MRIEEAQAKEEELEKAILGMLGEFEEETGLSVVGIELGRMDVSSMGSPDRSILAGVRVDTLL